MATSGLTAYSASANEIIKQAYRKTKTIKGDTPIVKKTLLDPALEQLNMLVQTLAADGFRMWKRERVKIDLVKHKHRYIFGTLAQDVQTIKTASQLVAVASSGDTTIDVLGASTSFAANDPIDIYQNNGVVLSTTVSGSPSALTATTTRLTLATALTADMVVGNQVDVWQDDTRVPDKLISAFVREDPTADTTSTSDTPVEIMSKEEWEGQSNKRDNGSINAVFYDRGVNYNYLYTWQESDDANDELHLLCQMPIEYFSSETDTPDFPKEWYLVLVYGLADLLIDDADNATQDDRISIATKLRKFKEIATNNDIDHETSVKFAPDIREW